VELREELREFEPLTPSMRRRAGLWPVVAGRGWMPVHRGRSNA